MKCRLPMRIGGGGGSAAPTPVSVTITGTGNTTYCYATIGGTKRYGAGTYEVMPGDKITFGVYGRSSSYYGRVTIDGQQVLNVTNQTTQTYEWTVPEDISAISMQMSYTSSSYSRNGRIVVTTTKKPTGGGGSSSSEYAVTVSDSSDFIESGVETGDLQIYIGSTQIQKIGTYTAAPNSKLRIVLKAQSGPPYQVIVNGSAATSATNAGIDYSHTITSNTTLSMIMTNPSAIQFSITTE